MLLSSLSPDHEIRIRCDKCGEQGMFTAAELMIRFGDNATLEKARRHFEKQRCCKQPIKVETRVH